MIATQPMIDVLATQKELERLANELDRSGDAIAAIRLRKLNAAVGSDPAASPDDWATTDIQKIISPDAIAEGMKGRAVPGRLVRIFEWARNSLVLFPLILTWLGIWRATSAYEALLSAHSELTNQPFLFLWQQGFGHTLFPPFILSNLALVDFSLLAIIFILTLVVTWQYNLVNTQSEKNAEQLRESLAHALGDATLCLVMAHRQRQQQQPTDLADVARYLYQFGQQFQQTSQQFLNELAEERKRRGDLSAFTAALEKITKDMVSAADSMKQTNIELTAAVKEVLGPVKEIPKLVVAAGQAVAQLNTMVATLGQLVADQGRWRQELQTVLANGLGQLTADQRKATQELHDMLDASMRQLHGSLGQQLTEQRNAAQELRNLLNALLTRLIAEQQQQGQALQNILVVKLGEIASQTSASLGQLVAEQQALGEKLADTADALENTVTRLGVVVQGIEDATQEQKKMLVVMQLQQTAQKNLTDEMTAATAEIKNVLKSVREAGPELRSMSVDIANFVRALRDTPTALKAELLDPLKYYSSAAANVAAGSQTLEKAAHYLESVTNKLDGRLGP
jgi:hypothetical protein